MTGDGGAGKTRLALRLCKDLAAQGRRSLWVHPGREAYAAEAVRKLGPCLLVVDYAETRDNLRSMLSDGEAGYLADDPDDPFRKLIHQVPGAVSEYNAR